jgi:hypothetical protein
MKFFTPEWHSGDLPDSESDTIAARYLAHIAGLALPPVQQQLANDVSLHDALVERVSYDAEREVLEVGFLAGDLQQGYKLVAITYAVGVDAAGLSAAFQQLGAAGSEVLYGEVDQESAESWVHRLLF